MIKPELITKKEFDEKQKDVDDLRNYSIENFLTVEEKKQHKKIENTLSNLTKLKIPVYIYAELPYVNLDGKKEKCVIQYNNLKNIFGDVLDENIPKNERIEYALKTHHFHMGFIYNFLFSQLESLKLDVTKLSEAEVLENFKYVFTNFVNIFKIKRFGFPDYIEKFIKEKFLKENE